MDYDFEQIIDRRVTGSLKWHGYDEDVLAMWVADMDFVSPEPVLQALRERVEHGVFGYELAPEALKTAIVERLSTRYNWSVTPESIVFLPGVVPGFMMAARAFVKPEEGLLIQTPVYPPILNAAQPMGITTQPMPLTRQEDGSYDVDFDLFAATFTEQTRMFLLCNPHNPVGRVFGRAELMRMAEECLRRDVVICSDEIHCDLIYRGHEHLPIAALAPEIAARTITLMAPSKTFNIAGLHCSFAVVPDAELRKTYQAARAGLVGWPNLLGTTAALAAYEGGQPWLDALMVYLEANRDFVFEYVREHLAGVKMAQPEGTYLAWLDCRASGIVGNPYKFFLEHGRVALNDGATFGPGGEGFVRLNFGCPRALLEDGLGRMRRALDTLPK